MQDNEDPFCLVDLGCIVDQYNTWCEYLPTVKPFYAVKCNDDIAMLKTLAVLGAGFDCASKVRTGVIYNDVIDDFRKIVFTE